MPKCRTLVLVSGNGSNLQAIIDREKELNIQIVGVISNRPLAYALERARQANITTEAIDHTDYSTREDYDTALAETMSSFNPDLVVLAGYMRIMSAHLVEQFVGKMINIHPSLLPKYPGLHTHRRALEANDNEHGSTVHFVTAELDGGPTIAQKSMAISKNDTEGSLANRIKDLEHQLYPEVIKWFAAGQLRFSQGLAWLNQEPLKHPVKL